MLQSVITYYRGEPYVTTCTASARLRLEERGYAGREGLRRRRDTSAFYKTSRAINNHPVIKPGYRATTRLDEGRGEDCMQETRDSAYEHSRPERHRVPLMLEIRFAD